LVARINSRADQMPISYSRHSGIASDSCDTTSGGVTIADTMNVYTYDPAAAKYTAVATFNDNMATPTWTRFSVSLPVSLAGKSIQIGFQATTDNARNTNFWVDSVALDVVACGS